MAGPRTDLGMYAAQARGVALDIGAIVALAEAFKTLADGEQAATGALDEVPERFSLAAQGLITAEGYFRKTAKALLATWHSKVESKDYETAVDQSAKSLADSAAAIDPSPLSGIIGAVTVNAGIAQSNATLVVNAAKIQQTLMQEPGAAFADTTGVLTGLKQQLVQVGASLDALGQQYVRLGQQAVAMANSAKWQGPHSNSSGGRPSPTRAVSTPDGGPSGGPAGPSGGPGGEQPGGAGGEQPGGSGGEQPGGASGEQPGGAGGAPGGKLAGGGAQGGPAGPELSGMPPATVPKPAPLAPLTPLPPIAPPDHTPPPTTPLTPISPVGAGGSGGLSALGRRGAGGGGVGGGGIGGSVGGGGSAKLGELKPLGNGAQQIPSVVKGGQGEPAVSTGRPPTMPTSTGAAGGGSGGGTTGGSGIPPMMPPMGAAGAAAAGAGRGGKPGSGAIRSSGRRTRTGGPTPGVPDRLRGRAGAKDIFPAKLSARRERDRPETLEILDEELWTVDPHPEPPTSSPTRPLPT